jgi:hypothetical protein
MRNVRAAGGHFLVGVPPDDGDEADEFRSAFGGLEPPDETSDPEEEPGFPDSLPGH